MRNEWMRVLAHRVGESADATDLLIRRFIAAGIDPEVLHSHLSDAGDRIYQAQLSGPDQWATAFGGHRAVALISAEISALMAHLVARAAQLRAVSVGALLDDYSAVTVAAELGVARQKVYELARISADRPFVRTTPWRTE